MNANEILMMSIQNVREMYSNSILILRDVDTQLSEHNLMPLFGNTLGPETSKSITQTTEQFNTFFPQFMCRVYVKAAEQHLKVVFVNVQFYHPNHPTLGPTVNVGVFTLPEPYTSIELKKTLYYWWLKYAIFETNTSEQIDVTGNHIETKPWIENGDTTVCHFWSYELVHFQHHGDIQSKIVQGILQYFSTTRDN
ncbi:hypothetical protein CN326_09785 [Bacillus sp. AFS018417]|uniref:hypothetical protein n=1 Tax=Bacillus sp. AFS018417 TaxID=2033491 RepID=UPI000BF7C508|nr:hypothetical protein [Bacillus sp. AFS018417]PEZ06742.1 hypothetical protein CN326_09785 [Bacillus sp. AFS018417]